MSTTLVALVVGAFSGLLGSIAGPALSHLLSRRHRRELREEDQNREIRAMIQAEVHLSLLTLRGFSEAWRVYATGGNPEAIIEQFHRFNKAVFEATRSHYWRPHWIRDACLKKLAVEMSRLQGGLARELILLDNELEEQQSRYDRWKAQTEDRMEREGRLLHLIEAVQDRIFELAW